MYIIQNHIKKKIIITVNNPNPTIFSWEKRVFENFMFLNIFQIISIRYVSKGSESITTVKYIKRIISESPDRSPITRNSQNMGDFPEQLAMASSSSPGKLHQRAQPSFFGFLSGTHLIFLQKPDFWSTLSQIQPLNLFIN